MRTPETLTAAQRAAALKLAPTQQPSNGMNNSTKEKEITAEQKRAEAAKNSLMRPTRNATSDLNPMDEVDGSIVVLSIHDIDPYKYNPRTKPNPKRSEIKASMAIDGITNMITVTRRNPAEKYFPYGGGNTRIELAKELLSEGNEQFAQIKVLARKWPGEAAVISAHLSENDNRGDISFWERSQGVQTFKRELENEFKKPYSAAELNKALKERGLDYGIRMIQNFLFSVEYLSLIGNWLQSNDVNITIRPIVGTLLEIASKFDRKKEIKEAIEEIFLMHATDLEATEKINLEKDPAEREEVKLDVTSMIIDVQTVAAKKLGFASDRIQAVIQSLLQNPKLSADDLRKIQEENENAPRPGPGTSQQTSKANKQAPLGGMLGGVPSGQPGATTTPESRERSPSPPTTTTSSEPPEKDKKAIFTTQLTDAIHALHAVIPISDFIKPEDALPYGFVADIPESMSQIGGQNLNPEQEDLRIYLWPIIASLTGQCNMTLIPACNPELRWIKAVSMGVDYFYEKCKEIGIPCAKNGLIFPTSANFGYVLCHPDAGKRVSALLKIMAEYHSVSAVHEIPFKPLFL